MMRSSVARPSLAPSGLGGRPRSSVITGGSRLFTNCIADCWSRAKRTSYSSKVQASCFCSPTSSSTISSVGFVVSILRTVHIVMPAGGGRLRHGKADPHDRAATRFGDDVELTAQGGRVFAAFIDPDAEARSFGRHERSEQFFAHEIGIHSRPVILDLDDRRIAGAEQPDAHMAMLADGVDRVLH